MSIDVNLVPVDVLRIFVNSERIYLQNAKVFCLFSCNNIVIVIASALM